MNRSEHRDAGHGAGQQADGHGREGQQGAGASQRQQQDQDDADGGAGADPAAFGHGLCPAGGRVQGAARHQQFGAVRAQDQAVLLQLRGDALRRAGVEGIVLGFGAHQHPALASLFRLQGARAEVVLHGAAGV
ncbi:hypothetical protein D9M70_580750 [compost metagenome]